MLVADDDLGADLLTVEQARPAVVTDQGHRPVMHLDLAVAAESLQGFNQAGGIGRLDLHDGEMGHRESPPGQARKCDHGLP
jgi:hypothetical protein